MLSNFLGVLSIVNCTFHASVGSRMVLAGNLRLAVESFADASNALQTLMTNKRTAF